MSTLLCNMLSRGRYMKAAGDEGSDTSGTDTAVEETQEDDEANSDAQSNDTSMLGLSDEDFLKQPMPTEVAPRTTEKVETKAEKADSGTKPGDEDLDPDNPDAGDDKGVKAEADKSAEGDDADAGAEGADGKAAEKPEAKGKTDKPADKPDEKVEDTKAEKKTDKPEGTVDFEAEYKKMIGTPLKANGREVVVKSAEDMIALAQMGLNYNKKMAGLKPVLKLVKMLENNGLLTEERIGFLIDVHRKDPAAISKLVKDSGTDPLDLSAEKASAYKPGNHGVSDTEVDLDSTLADLKDSPAYSKTLEAVTKWDAASKQAVAQSPQVLKIVHDHVEMGIYDRITKEVENERLFGRLSGLSDIEAYRQVGDAMNKAGKFDDLVQGSSQTKSETPPPKKVVVPAPKKAADKDREDRRRAASPAKPAPASSTLPVDFNPLAMSDEEFEKHARQQFV